MMNSLSPQARVFYSWLHKFPVSSKKKLKEINTAADSSRHIILTVKYSATDSYIRCLSRIIIHFLLIRMKHEKRGTTKVARNIESTMSALHEAVDAITGVSRRSKNSHELCKSA